MIFFENEDLVACNKPSGLLSIPDREGKDPSLKLFLQEKYGKIFTVHRLDKDTSGLIIFAKNEEAHKFLSQQFEERKTEKYYLGIVNGSPQPTSGTVEARIAEHSVKAGLMVINRRGKDAITDYEVEEDFGIYALMRYRIYTGRTHQIRIHMKEIGHPLIADPLYGDGKPLLLSSIKSKFKLSKNEEEERPILNRLALHAFQLNIMLPNGEWLKLEAEMPKDMRASVQQLRKRKEKKSRN